MNKPATITPEQALPIVTYFEHYKRTDEPLHLSVHDALERIRNGEARAKVEAIRNEADPAKRKALKEGLPIVCWSGRFTKRNEAGMEEQSRSPHVRLVHVPIR